MAKLLRDGVGLVYEVAGTGEPAMVFVHGWTSDRSCVAPQAAHFSRSHRCVSMDLRGHGESDAPEQEYTIEGFAEDVGAICDELRVTDAVLVGHSMGGAIVLAMSMMRPDLARAVVLLDPAILFPPEAQALMRQTAQVFAAPGGLAALRAFFEGQFFLPSSDPALKTRVTEAGLKTPQHVIGSALANLAGFDSASALKKLSKPLLYIGAEPAIANPERVREFAPHAVTAKTAGSGHFHQLEVPEQVNSMLERFLAISNAAAPAS
jgi:pimeloyl-ACP methyl ester carboxylesterase